jgi:hypothetical protein
LALARPEVEILLNQSNSEQTPWDRAFLEHLIIDIMKKFRVVVSNYMIIIICD